MTEAEKDALYDAAERMAESEKELQFLRRFLEFAIGRTVMEPRK